MRLLEVSSYFLWNPFTLRCAATYFFVWSRILAYVLHSEANEWTTFSFLFISSNNWLQNVLHVQFGRSITNSERSSLASPIVCGSVGIEGIGIWKSSGQNPLSQIFAYWPLRISNQRLSSRSRFLGPFSVLGIASWSFPADLNWNRFCVRLSCCREEWILRPCLDSIKMNILNEGSETASSFLNNVRLHCFGSRTFYENCVTTTKISKIDRADHLMY